MIDEAEKIKSAWAKVGTDNYDWVSELIKLLQEGIEDDKSREGIVRALAAKEARGKANTVVLDEYDKIPKEKMILRWAVGNTIGEILMKDDQERVLRIVKDKSNGMSRQMIVMFLYKIKSEEIENVLIDLLDDDDVSSHAIYALGKLKSIKSREKISAMINHPKTLIRKEAKYALKKIDKEIRPK